MLLKVKYEMENNSPTFTSVGPGLEGAAVVMGVASGWAAGASLIEMAAVVCAAVGKAWNRYI